METGDDNTKAPQVEETANLVTEPESQPPAPTLDNVYKDEDTTPPPLPCMFGKFFFLIMNLTFIALATVVSALVTQNSYNTDAPLDWVLVGGITENSFIVRVRMDVTLDTLIANARHEEQHFVVASEPIDDFNDNVRSIIVVDEILNLTRQDINDYTDALTITELNSSQTYYYYRIVRSMNADSTNAVTVMRQGQVMTAPAVGQRGRFKFAAAGCAMTGSQHEVFDMIADEPDLLFYIQLGDLHYEDINTEDLGKRMNAIDKVMGSKSQANLYAHTGFCYMWDDHDWLGNDSHGDGEGREAAIESYLLAFPHYEPLPDGKNQSMYQAFTIGTVRIVISDLRSESTNNATCSPEQMSWLYQEFSQSDQYDFVIWVTPSPWIGPAEDGADNWMGRPEQRTVVSNWISELFAAKQNLLAISSDAHMVAFDDGSHTYYGDASPSVARTTMSFPILQSGPLDRLGSIKGGPYSGGCTTYTYERDHQYSVVEFIPPENDNGQPCLQITSYQITPMGSKEEIFSKQLCGPIFSSNEQATEGSCDEVPFSTTNEILLIVCGALLLIAIVEICFLREGILNFLYLAVVTVLGFGLGVLLAMWIPYSRDYQQFDTYTMAWMGVLQLTIIVVYFAVWVCMASKRRKLLAVPTS